MEKCKPTEDHVERPFYRPCAPDVTDLYPADSTGPVLWFTGSVSDTDCQPLTGTVLEVWQADGRQPLTTEIELLPDEYTASDQLYNPHLAVPFKGREETLLCPSIASISTSFCSVSPQPVI
jgi:hypothetical protein